MKNLYFVIGLMAILFFSCEDAPYVPKPKVYPKINFPEKKYQPFDKNYCKFSFEYPVYAQIQQDTMFFEEKPNNPCWFNIHFPELNADIHCSYYNITGKKSFDKLVNDAHELANKHNIKADYIDEMKIQKPNHVSGFVFDIEGPAASPFQFYLTDSTRHFMRGSLYINAKTNPDSLAPVYKFLKEDILQLINTFEWNKK
ncbi:MAG: hypothetical protein IPL95_01290 [Saprospiraceae bacterium]|nr:hypothetical protein [Saprospiraceae bacterium]